MKKSPPHPPVFFAYIFSISAAWLLELIPNLSRPSTSKVILVALVTVITLAAFSFLLISLFVPRFRAAFLHLLDRWLGIIASISALIFVVSGYAFLRPGVFGEAYAGYFAPAAGWLWGTSGGSLLLLFSRRAKGSIFAEQKDILRPAALSLVVLLLLWAGIAITRIGLTPDVAWWSETGTPILIAQALFAWSVGTAAWIAPRLLPALKKYTLRPKTLDTLLCVVIWLATFISWQTAPLQQDHFITQPVPPNFEYYPYSDALLYDLSAQQLLLGEGVSRASATKPLYAAFLALAHAVAGQDYARTASFQTAILAFIPVLLFLLTKSLSNRSAGLIAALLALMREHNSILLTDTIKVSNSKMFMSDMPAMAAMLLLTLLMVRWIQKPARHAILPLAIGGAVGLFSLLRGQILFLAPLIVLFILFAFRRQAQVLKAGLPLLLLGMALSLLPWLTWKTWTANQIDLNEAMPRPTNIAYKYTLTDTTCDPSTTPQACNEQARQLLVRFVLTNPLQVAHFISAHFIHNLIESALYLPPSLRIETPEELVSRLPLWDYRWRGELPPETLLLITINLALIALGIGAAWSKTKTAVLLPLILYLGYILTVSLARTSGYRFILPVDWVSLVFYAIGLMQTAAILFGALLPASGQTIPPEQASQQQTKIAWKGLLIASLFLLLIGALLPLAEMLIPKRYPPPDSKEKAAALYREKSPQTLLQQFPSESIAAFLEEEQSVLLHGRALYPRYFRNPESNAVLQPYLLFYIAGPTTSAVILPLNSKPAHFPNASEVILLGCWKSGDLRDIPKYIEASLVILPEEEQILVAPSAWQGLSCLNQ